MFEFSIRGEPRDLDAARRHRKPYTTASDNRLYRPSVELRVSAPGRPRSPQWYRLQIDTGADCCVFANLVATAIGLQRPADAHEEQLRTGAGLVIAWFAEVNLHLGFSTDPYEFDWTTPVGFVRDDVLPASFPAGILGIGGGLERFLSTQLILSPDVPESPVVRILTPRA